MKLVKLENGTVESSDKMASVLLFNANNSMLKNNEYYIYGVEKDNVLEIKKEAFENENALRNQVNEYSNNGFNVYSNIDRNL